MAKKSEAIQLPSERDIKIVLDNAFSAPQANCAMAQQTLAAITAVDAFFRQMRSQAAGAIPQASANAAGSPSPQA